MDLPIRSLDGVEILRYYIHKNEAYVQMDDKVFLVDMTALIANLETQRGIRQFVSQCGNCLDRQPSQAID